MAITARTWVEGEVATASKFNTIRDDILELNAVAGFVDTQYCVGTITNGNTSVDVTVSAISARAAVIWMGQRAETGLSATGSLCNLSKVNSTTIRANRYDSSGTVIVTFCILDPRG